MAEKFVTTVRIAVPHSGKASHVMHTEAQNLASSAHDLKTALAALVKAATVAAPDDQAALRAVFDELAGERKDKKVYENRVKRAQAAYQEIKEEQVIAHRKLADAVNHAVKVLHESNCITPMPEVTPDMHKNLATVEGTDLLVDLSPDKKKK